MVKYLQTGILLLIMTAIIIIVRPRDASNTFASETVNKYITVIDQGTAEYATRARTVEDFLKEQQISVKPEDLLNYSKTQEIRSDMVLIIKRGFYVTVTIDGVSEQIYVSPGITAGQLHEEYQKELDTALLYSGDSSGELKENSQIDFYTLRNEIETEYESIPYETEYATTTSLSYGLERPRNTGEEGIRKIETLVVYISDEEFSREVINDVVIYEPVTEIVDRGVGGALGTLTNTSLPSFRYREVYTMNASAYTAGFECTGKNPGDPGYGITKSGMPVEHGIVAVDPEVIPLGTRLYVEGYGYSIAADIGSAIKGMKIDLYIEHRDDALRFGRRNITVYVLD